MFGRLGGWRSQTINLQRNWTRRISLFGRPARIWKSELGGCQVPETSNHKILQEIMLSRGGFMLGDVFLKGILAIFAS